MQSLSFLVNAYNPCTKRHCTLARCIPKPRANYHLDVIAAPSLYLVHSSGDLFRSKIYALERRVLASNLLHLGQRLVRAAAVVLGAVREQPVNNHADNREEEDDQAPEKLVNRRAV